MYKRKIILFLILFMLSSQILFADFTASDIKRMNIAGYEYYSPLDIKGRCGYAEACIGKETMPTEKRKSISYIYPSGWVKGIGFERCHLIAFCLSGENGNRQNLITGTHYLNINEMLPIEMAVLHYIEDTGHHVLYRATPLYIGDKLICEGVRIEAESVEDNKIKIDAICYQIKEEN